MGTVTKIKGGAGTDEKVGPKQKRCCDCGVVKNRLKAFKPRWGRCSKHKEAGKPFQEKCKGCVEIRNSNIRQPRCVDCDAERTKKVAAAKVVAKKGGKKAKGKGKKGTTVEVPGDQTVTPPPVQTPAPVVVAVSTPIDALAAVSNLLNDTATEVPAPTLPF